VSLARERIGNAAELRDRSRIWKTGARGYQLLWTYRKLGRPYIVARRAVRGARPASADRPLETHITRNCAETKLLKINLKPFSVIWRCECI
jgi:hypothetical protein